MSSSRYETFSRFKSHTMVGLCVLFTIIILVMLGLVTGFLTVKGYKGMLARPKLIHGAIVAATDKTITISGVFDESGATTQATFNDGSGTLINIDNAGAAPTDLAAGMQAYLRYSTTDPHEAVYVGVVGKVVEGTVSSVEVLDDDKTFSGTLTVDRSDGTTASYRIRKTTPISVNGKTALADVPERARVRVQLSARDEKRAIAVDSPAAPAPVAQASGSQYLPPILSEDAILSPFEPKYPGGLRNGIVGTLILIVLASVIGIPVGMLTGVFLAEYSSGSRLANPVRFIADVLTGVPSIVVGILGYELLVRPLKDLGLKYNGWAGALALAFIMIPLVARTTEEMLLLVPRSYREASVALGATKSRTILRVVLPAATGSVITGIMLAIARVAGETAPLLFTVGGLDALELNPNHQFPALTLQIFKYSQTSDNQLNNLAWSGILILLILIFVLNVVVRFTAKAMSKGKAAT
jgi:phosphate transport system permease protein